jgi:LuxR family transcriptional regulator, maltose regulon positive regulatory protein
MSEEMVDVPGAHRAWVVAFLLGAMARDALRYPGAAERALPHALGVAESDQVLSPFLVQPSPDLFDRHARHHAVNAALISETAGMLAGADKPVPPPGLPTYHREAPTHGEIRVLYYLPTNLSAREIAGELYLSVNTVKTHQRHLYQKLGVRSRTQAVERARALGLLAPFSRGRCQ